MGQGLRVPSSHLGSVVEMRSWPVRLWGPLVAAAHRTPWQDLGGEDRSPRDLGSRGGCRQHPGLPSGAVRSQTYRKERRKRKEDLPSHLLSTLPAQCHFPAGLHGRS